MKKLLALLLLVLLAGCNASDFGLPQSNVAPTPTPIVIKRGEVNVKRILSVEDDVVAWVVSCDGHLKYVYTNEADVVEGCP